MTITLYNSHPFTFYMPFHTSPRVDPCPIHAPSNCTMALDPCARPSLIGRTDPYYTDIFYSSCGLKRPAATLAFPLLCNCTVPKYLFQRGSIWVLVVYSKFNIAVRTCFRREVPEPADRRLQTRRMHSWNAMDSFIRENLVLPVMYDSVHSVLVK